MARSKRILGSVMVGALFAAASAGCLFVTDFDPIGSTAGNGPGNGANAPGGNGAGGDGAAAQGGDQPGGGGSGGQGGPGSCEPPIAGIAEFYFNDNNDRIDGMAAADDGAALIVGRASAGSTLRGGDPPTAIPLFGSFLARVTEGSVTVVPLASAQSIHTSVTVLQDGTVVTVTVTTGVVTIETFTVALGVLEAMACTLDAGVFTGADVSTKGPDAGIIFTRTAGGDVTCGTSILDGGDSLVAVGSYPELDAAAPLVMPDFSPVAPDLVLKAPDVFRACFGDGHCLDYKGGWQEEELPELGKVTRSATRGDAVASIGGGTFGMPTPLAAEEDGIDIFASAGLPPPSGGVIAVTAQPSTLLVSGFRSSSTLPEAQFLKMTGPLPDMDEVPWEIATFEVAPPSWGAGGFLDDFSSTLTAVVMYPCPGDKASRGAVIINQPF